MKVNRSGKTGKGATRWDFGLNTSKDTSKGFSKGTSSHSKTYPKKDESRPSFRKGGSVKKSKRK